MTPSIVSAILRGLSGLSGLSNDMVSGETKATVSAAISNLAMQLYVADIQKCPVDKLHLIRPMDAEKAKRYVLEASRVWIEALSMVEESSQTVP